ncbi:transmembrane protein 145 [Diabrotica virgifera virgifera]|uniref:Transmembrane protein 145 n=1 Tax=Diabrotica virgifera virgifera TaxID=50390 RepID=A0A6P7FFK4_DIAVI|nr:transmembrane protein 145 [Diabrotica virgifera virgifera]
MSKNNIFKATILLICVFIQNGQCTHLKGTFKSDEFFKFLIKFGFQKTDQHQAESSHGYIFGNITSKQKFSVPITFAVLDRQYFLDYYKNRVIYDKDRACKNMFSTLKTRAYDSKCSKEGKDYLRRIPCAKGKLCEDEDNPYHVVKNNQFTYVIQDFKQPSFWYLSIVACYHDVSTCEWKYYHTYTPYEIDYDIWLVNGNPNGSSISTLTYQFSFDRQNTLELYLVFWLCYMVLVPLQCHAVKTQKHPVTRLFTASLILDFIALCLILVHTLRYALDGVGYPKLAMTGDIFDILSRTSFMLLLLLLAKGWAVTRLELTWKPLVFAIWLCYGIVHILLYVWNLTEVDIIEDIDEYQTWPGWLIIVFRSLIMIWFLYELRTTMLYEHNTQKLNFLLHFGASSLVWFIYLPILALIALHVSALWRFKLLLGITYSADCFAYCVMAHLLWPTRSEQYFLLKGPSSADLEELDEFNEAPHIVNNSYTSMSSINSYEICKYDANDTQKTKLINVNT